MIGNPIDGIAVLRWPRVAQTVRRQEWAGPRSAPHFGFHHGALTDFRECLAEERR
ncbi:hypothetical protein [Streptomyces hypolithicus]